MIMDYVIVSVTCTNCGSTGGGFCECCYNCSGTVTGYYSVDIDGRTIIKNVETHGGAKKR